MEKNYKYYQEKNNKKSRLLSHIFMEIASKEESGIITEENENPKNEVHFFRENLEKYCTETTELYFEICNKSEFRDSQLEIVTKEFIVPHIKNLIKSLKNGIQYGAQESDVNYLIKQFLSINFGSYISNEYIIEHLIEGFEGRLPNQFATLQPYLNKLRVPKEEEQLLDYSDTTNQEKIIFLYKLGVLDLLKTKPAFLASTNQMAKYLSAITGIKATTLQSYINPIYSENVSQTNNPLINEKNVNKVEQKLINMGFDKDTLLS